MNLNQFIRELQEIQSQEGEEKSEEIIVATNNRKWNEFDEVGEDEINWENPSLNYPLNLKDMSKSIDEDQSFLLIGS